MTRVPPSRSHGASRGLAFCLACLALLAAAAVLAGTPGTDFADSFEVPFPNSTWQVTINGTTNRLEARVPLTDATPFRPVGPWDGMMALRVQYGGSSGSAQAEAAALYPGGTLTSASLRLMLYVPSATANAFSSGSQVRIARLMSDKSDTSADLALFMVRGSAGGMFLQGEYRTTLGPVRIGAVDKTGIASDTWHTVELQFVNGGITGSLSLYVDDAQLPRDGTTGLSLLGSSFGAVGVGLSGLASPTSTGTVAWWMDDVALSSGFNGHGPPRVHFHQDGYETPNVSVLANPPGKSLVETSGGSVAHILLGHRDGGMEADDQTTAAAVSAAYGELRGMDPTTSKVFHRVWWRQGGFSNLGNGHPLAGITSSGLTGVSTGAVKLPMAALSLASTGAVVLWGYSQAGGVASRDLPVTVSGPLGPGWHLLELEVDGAGTATGQRFAWVDGQLAPVSTASWSGVVPTQWADGHLPDDQALGYVGRDDYDDSRTSAGSQPSQFTVLGGTADVNVGACTPITIQVIDSFGGLAAPPEDVPLSYNAGGAGSFFTDATCTSAVTVLPVPSGVSALQFYFLATGAITGPVTLALSSLDYLARNSTLRILSATPGDTTPPSVPGPAVPAALWNRAPVLVTWTGSRDNIGGSGLVGYDVQVSKNDGGWAPWRTVPAIIPGADSGIVFDGGESFWRLRVTARDDAGNVSAPGLESPLVTMDFTPPDQPGTPSGTLLGGGLASVTWTASGDPGPAPSGIASYTLAVTDPFGTTSLYLGLTTNSYPSLPVSPNQTYRMVVTASDRAGNASSPSLEGRLVVTGPTAGLRLLGLGPFAVMDDNYPVTVEAVDDAGYVTTGYQGAVTFAATLAGGGAASADLPAGGGPYQFRPADQGRHWFDAGFAFHLTGDVTAAVTDAQGLGRSVPVTVISATDVRIVHDARLLATSGVPYLYNAAGRVHAVSGDLRLTYSSCGGPSEFLVDASTGAVSWTPPGGNQAVDLCVQARTSGGASDSYPFQVTVRAPGALPSA
ncbi:MAG TPA: hypothetical protein VND93_23435, partial [Myxococcales bacterium]|nr:hypothetical protein [Myxococcales bacterium]